jgi:acyl-coenzyme A thioesterase PaaI-like protein
MAADFEKLIALMPFAGYLGITIVEASGERVVADLPWAPKLCTSGGVMHGGVLMSLADTIGAAVVVLGLAEGETTASWSARRPRSRRSAGPSAAVDRHGVDQVG